MCELSDHASFSFLVGGKRCISELVRQFIKTTTEIHLRLTVVDKVRGATTVLIIIQITCCYLIISHRMAQLFKSITCLEDSRPIRKAAWHPSGEIYAVGTNSRKVKICAYPTRDELKHLLQTSSNKIHFDNYDNFASAIDGSLVFSDCVAPQPKIHYEFHSIHQGSVYCLAFDSSGCFLASGSNDRNVHIIKYDQTKHLPEGSEYKLTVHSGTIRDLFFMPNCLSGDTCPNTPSSLLVCAGSGDNEICIIDCETMKPISRLTGHDNTVMALTHWNDPTSFASCGLDSTLRYWDIRDKRWSYKFDTSSLKDLNLPINPPSSSIKIDGRDQVINKANGSSSADISSRLCSMSSDQEGKLLACGFADGRYMLFDIRNRQPIQVCKLHDSELRALSISPKSYYLLTGDYGGKLLLSDLQGNLKAKLPSVELANIMDDKFVSCAWHPKQQTFLTTSASKSAILWAPDDGLTATSCPFDLSFAFESISSRSSATFNGTGSVDNITQSTPHQLKAS